MNRETAVLGGLALGLVFAALLLAAGSLFSVLPVSAEGWSAIAQRLKQKSTPEEIIRARGIDPDVVETAALAHDLGHPPFGHLAEEELDHLLSKEGLTDGFEGNAQTFRLVTRLEKRPFE